MVELSKIYLKWGLLCVVLLLLVVNYYALVETVQFHFVQPLEMWLRSLGYHPDIENPAEFVMGKLVPGLVLVFYLIKNKPLELVSNLYEVVTFNHLLVLLAVLPCLLYLQNGHLGKIENYGTNKN